MISRLRHWFFIATLGAACSAVAAQGPPPMQVGTCPITEREMAVTSKLVGTVLAERTSTVASEVAGPIAELLVREGDFLRRGDVICRLDSEIATYRLAEAEATLLAKRERLAELVNGTRPEELRRWKAAVAEAQALHDRWEYENRRVQALYDKDAGSPTERHNTEMEFLAAARRLEQTKAIFEEAENGARAEVVAQSRAEVAAQEAIVSRLKRELDRTTVRAPFDGFVTARYAEPGEWIELGGEVVDMVGMETVRIRADVPESFIPFARAGEAASVDVEALSLRLPGQVTRVIPQATAAARTFPLEIDLPNADHRLLPGMFVWAHVPSGPPGKRMMVHKDAVVVRGGTNTVYVIRTDDKGAQTAIPVTVETGIEVVGEVEIRGVGLEGATQAVCRANERLYGPGPVIATPAPLPPRAKGDAVSTNGN